MGIVVNGSDSRIIINLNGKNDIHVRFISRSYRIRGMVARTLINMAATQDVFMDSKIILAEVVRGLKVVIRTVIIDMKMIFVYSDIKINAKTFLAYSVLKPDTNSLSPSARSNGVRLVSASNVVNQINKRGGIRIDELNGVDLRNDWRLKEVKNLSNEIRISAILTSYEIVCATLRKAPKRAYFELEDQPLIIVV